MNVMIEFKGPYDEVFDLVDEIRATGASVAWDPPDRDRGDLWHDIAVSMIATGTTTAITETIRSFLSRHRSSSVKIQERTDEEPNEENLSDDDSAET